METNNMENKEQLLKDWREAQRLFQKVALETHSSELSGGGWDRSVRIWDDFERIIGHLEKK